MESEVGVGSRFAVSVPFGHRGGPAAAGPAGTAVPDRNPARPARPARGPTRRRAAAPA